MKTYKDIFNDLRHDLEVLKLRQLELKVKTEELYNSLAASVCRYEELLNQFDTRLNNLTYINDEKEKLSKEN